MEGIKIPSYTYICFTDLAYEFDISERKETEKKIKRRLKYYKKEAYNQERIDYIRKLRNELYNEINRGKESKYWQKPRRKHADLTDYNISKMAQDFQEQYNEISSSELTSCITFAIYIFHTK